MSTTFTRLLWKEFRTQRMLWTTLVIAAFSFYVILRLLVSSWMACVSITIGFVFLYLAAAFAITFAVEVEDSTATLLRMLPLRTSILIAAKISAVLSSSVGLVIAILILCTLMEPLFQLFPQLRRNQLNRFDVDAGDAMVFLCNMLLLCSASVFASLISHRVVSSVGKACLIVLVAYIVATTATTHIQLPIVARWLASSSLLLAVASCLLARPWHLGHLPPRWRTPEIAKKLAIPGIPSFAGLWRRWLRRIVGRPLTMPRILKMLTWRECRSAVPFALIWLSIGVLICVGRYFSNDAYPWPYFFLFVFIHECGQRIMRDDQRTGSVSLLANIGVHPLQVWISKTFVWICVMFVVGAVVIVVDTIMPTTGMPPSDPGRQMRISDFLHASTVSGQLHLSIWLVAVLALFSLGQLTACWIRSQIIAFATSIIGVLVSFPVVFQILHWDWPIWISLAPIPFCLLLATAATARRWMDRRVTWSLRICQFAMVALPCIVFPMVGQTIWKFQPAFALESLGHEPGSAVGSVYNLRNPGNSPEIAQLISMAQMRSEDWHTLNKPAETKCWYKFATAVERFPLHQMSIQQGGYRGDRNAYDTEPLLLSKSIYLEKGPEIIQELLQPFDEVLAKTNTFPLLPIAWTAPWSNTPAVALSMLLLEDARHREANGDIPGAVQQIGRAIHVNRSLAKQTSSWANWLACLDAERVALGRLRLLLGNADLSAIDLDNLLAELTSVLVMKQRSGNAEIQWQDPRMMLQRRTMFWCDAIHRGPFFLQLTTYPSVEQVFEAGGVWPRIQNQLRMVEGPGAGRTCHTMMFSEAILVSKYNSMGIQGKIQFLAQPTEERIQQLNRFLAGSGFTDLAADGFAVESQTEGTMLNPHIDTIASERATLLTIMLQKYRITHGKFPESLLDLPDTGAADDLIRTDPWTGAAFFYTATNHAPALRLLNIGDNPTFTAGQPLLFTPGASRGMLNTYVPQPIENGAVEMYKLPENVIPFLGLSDVVDWRYEQIATSVTAVSGIKAPTPTREAILPGQMSSESIDGKLKP